jgi:hypothetical protein
MIAKTAMLQKQIVEDPPTWTEGSPYEAAHIPYHEEPPS